MCGRYLLRHAPPEATHTTWDEYWRDIQIATPRYNIKPSQTAPVIVLQEGDIRVKEMVWGFQPFWSKKAYINSKAETLFELRTFKSAAQRHPCLIPADGFYEPKGKAGGYRPWYGFRFEDDRPFFFAGICTLIKSEGQVVENFSIITKAPNKVVQPIHDRMPVLWDETQAESCQAWLDTANKNRDRVLTNNIEYPDLVYHRVSDKAKSPKAEGEECFLSIENLSG